MRKKQSIQEFLAPQKLAIAGVSANSKKFGYAIFNELRQKGYEICPIHPSLEELEGIKCYASVLDIPDGFEKLFIVTPKNVTDKILKEAANKGIKHIWVQQTSNTKDTESIAKELGVNLIQKECIFMFAEPIGGVHRFHKAIWKLFGLLPK